MKRRAFVFSLDAFVAFSLILISIQSLLIITSVPKGYYPALLQAEFLAKDTLQAVSLAKDSANQSLLGSSSANIVGGLSPASQLTQATDSLIPPSYSYAYYFYNASSAKWILLYNASDPSHFDAFNPSASANGHVNVSYRRVAASAQMLMMNYSSPMVTDYSPYCNVVCMGWHTNANAPSSNWSGTDRQNCTKVPCDIYTKSNFQNFDFNVGLLRLTVWG